MKQRHVASVVDTMIPEQLLRLLATDDAIPPGEFLVEAIGEAGHLTRVLWRISEGEPAKGALDPAPGWSLLAV
jgi:hypothetical protein